MVAGVAAPVTDAAAYLCLGLRLPTGTNAPLDTGFACPDGSVSNATPGNQEDGTPFGGDVADIPGNIHAAFPAGDQGSPDAASSSAPASHGDQDPGSSPSPKSSSAPNAGNQASHGPETQTSNDGGNQAKPPAKSAQQTNTTPKTSKQSTPPHTAQDRPSKQSATPAKPQSKSSPAKPSQSKSVKQSAPPRNGSTPPSQPSAPQAQSVSTTPPHTQSSPSESASPTTAAAAAAPDEGGPEDDTDCPLECILKLANELSSASDSAGGGSTLEGLPDIIAGALDAPVGAPVPGTGIPLPDDIPIPGVPVSPFDVQPPSLNPSANNSDQQDQPCDTGAPTVDVKVNLPGDSSGCEKCEQQPA